MGKTCPVSHRKQAGEPESASLPAFGTCDLKTKPEQSSLAGTGGGGGGTEIQGAPPRGGGVQVL